MFAGTIRRTCRTSKQLRQRQVNRGVGHGPAALCSRLDGNRKFGLNRHSSLACYLLLASGADGALRVLNTRRTDVGDAAWRRAAAFTLQQTGELPLCSL